MRHGATLLSHVVLTRFIYSPGSSSNNNNQKKHRRDLEDTDVWERDFSNDELYERELPEAEFWARDLSEDELREGFCQAFTF